MTETENITNRILASKKYRGLWPPVVARTVHECSLRYKPEEVEERARNLLHQTWGAFLVGQPNWAKLLKKLEAGLETGRNEKELLHHILSEHSSTLERLPYLESFYQKIFDITGAPSVIEDNGCGLNPLTIPWMNLPPDCAYHAYDIDQGEIDFLNHVFALLKFPNANATPGDLLEIRADSRLRSSGAADGQARVDSLPAIASATAGRGFASIEFFLKLLPVLEHLESGASMRVLKESRAKYQVVSFPVASLSGREKGMVNFYGSRFESQLGNENWQWHRLDFPTELVYVIHRPDPSD